MKKNYINPAMEMISLANEDVLTVSTQLTSKGWEELFPSAEL